VAAGTGADALPAQLDLLRDKGFVIYDAAEVEAVGHMACANLAVTHDIYQTHLWVHYVVGQVSAPTSSTAPNLPTSFDNSPTKSSQPYAML
jgi:hypothetical protein